MLSKLSWTTLGYHYNWTERMYDHTKRQSGFPPKLAKLSSELAGGA
jgi:alkylated DNA repair protein alkB family protein 1